MRNIRNGDYMLRKLENEIVKECAPTLAGIKMANLFNYRFVSEDEFDSEIKTANMNLNEKGVYIEVLRKTDMSSLIYVYRPSMQAHSSFTSKHRQQKKVCKNAC